MEGTVPPPQSVPDLTSPQENAITYDCMVWQVPTTRVLLIFVLATLLSACESAAEREARTTRFFDEIAFGTPYDSHRPQDKRLRRWEGDIRAAIFGEFPPRYSGELRRMLSDLEAASGVSMQLLESSNGSENVRIHLTEKRRFFVNREFAACYIHKRPDAYVFVEADIYIRVDIDGGYDDCLAHELMHLMGFSFHSAALRSSLNWAQGESNLTEWDLLAVRALFDRKLSPGQPREQVIPRIEELMRREFADRSGYHRDIAGDG